MKPAAMKPPAKPVAPDPRGGVRAIPDLAQRLATRARAAGEAQRLERAWERRAGFALWLVATALIAVIAHVGSILVTPAVAPEDAFSRLERIAPRATLTPVAAPTPGREIAPFEDPSAALAVCRFDLDEGTLRVRTPVTGDDFLSMSVRTRDNVSVYALTDRAAVRGQIEFRVVSREQRDALEETDDEDGPRESRVLSPTREGYVLFRALAPSPGQMEEAQARLRGIVCALEPL